MVFLNFLKNTHGRNAVDGPFENYQQRDSQNRVSILQLRIIGNARSVFVIDRLFKLNFPETTEHTYTKLSIIYYYTKIRIMRK